LTHLVEKYDHGPVLISEISRKKKVPLKFLENILLELKKAGVLESKKGEGRRLLFEKSSIQNSYGKYYPYSRWTYRYASLCKPVFL
jgi:DNA-binding IscR family transcriptional regulator